MKGRLNDTQYELLEIIDTYIRDNGISPCIREVMELSRLKSTSTIHANLEKLKEKGYIIWRPGIPRTIRVIE